jgi:hypothetical protein
MTIAYVIFSLYNARTSHRKLFQQMEAANSSKLPVTYYQLAWLYIPVAFLSSNAASVWLL